MKPGTTPTPRVSCLLSCEVNSPSWRCFSQHVVRRLDSSLYFSASCSLPLLRRGRWARLSSARLRLEVSCISLSTWSSWNWTTKSRKCQISSRVLPNQHETRSHHESIVWESFAQHHVMLSVPIRYQYQYSFLFILFSCIMFLCLS